MEAGRRRKYQRKDENKATPSFDRRGSVPMIHCCHVGFIMSAAGLHHFLLLGVSRPAWRADRKESSSEVSRSPKTLSLESQTRSCGDLLKSRHLFMLPSWKCAAYTVTSGTCSMNPTLYTLQTWGPEHLKGSRWLTEDEWKESSREQDKPTPCSSSPHRHLPSTELLGTNWPV